MELYTKLRAFIYKARLALRLRREKREAFTPLFQFKGKFFVQYHDGRSTSMDLFDAFNYAMIFGGKVYHKETGRLVALKFRKANDSDEEEGVIF